VVDKVAVAERAYDARISSDIDFPYGNADSASERMVQAFSRWAGVTAFFAAFGALGVALLH
jgi:hypothetical protein